MTLDLTHMGLLKKARGGGKLTKLLHTVTHILGGGPQFEDFKNIF